MLNFYARVSGEVESDSGNSTLIYFRAFKKIRIKCYLYYLNEKIAHTKIKNPRTHMIFFSSILDLELLRFRFALRLPFLELKPPVIWFILLQSLICGINCTRCFFCWWYCALLVPTIMHDWLSWTIRWGNSNRNFFKFTFFQA